MKFLEVTFKQILVISGCDTSCEIAPRWMSVDLTHDKSISVQIMACWHQATSHYLSQCWLNSTSPYVLNRPQWVNPVRDKGPFILHIQYYDSWWAGDTRSQGISSHVIHLVILKYCDFNSRKVTMWSSTISWMMSSEQWNIFAIILYKKKYFFNFFVTTVCMLMS